MREFNESASHKRTVADGFVREIFSQADEYKEFSRGKGCHSSAGKDYTETLKNVFDRYAPAPDSECKKVVVDKQQFLDDLKKENATFAAKLTPLLSWVDKITVDGDVIDMHFNCEREKDKPQWLREGTLAADISTHGLFIPEHLRFRFVTVDGKTHMTGLKGLEIPVTVTDVPINIDKIALRSARISVVGDRLCFEIQAKNPAPFLGKFLPKHRQRPDPIPSVVYVDDEGKLEMRETWRKPE